MRQTKHTCERENEVLLNISKKEKSTVLELIGEVAGAAEVRDHSRVSDSPYINRRWKAMIMPLRHTAMFI